MIVSKSNIHAKYTYYVAVIVLVLAACFGIAQVFCMGLTNDTDLFMHQALIMWHHPDMMYTRVVQVNAPFNVMLYAPLAALAACMQISPSVVLHGFTFSASILSVAVLHYALKRHGVSVRERVVWCAAAAFILLVMTPAFEVFGDREHLLFVFALPWMIQMLLRLLPLRCTAVLAAAGFCMRPQDVVLFVILTLAGGPERTLLKRLLLPSSLIIAAIMALYALSVILFFPAYFTHMIPVIQLVHGMLQKTVYAHLCMGGIFIVLALAAMAAFVRAEHWVWYGFYAAILLLYLLNSGWQYTLYLLIVPLTIFCIMPWCFPLRGHSAWHGVARIVSVCVLLALTDISAEALKGQIVSTERTGTTIAHHHLPQPLTRDLRRVAGKHFILLSTVLWNIDIEPFNGDPQSVFGFDVLWPAVWLFSHQHDTHFSRILHFTTDLFLQAVKDYPNAPIIVDTTIKDKDILGLLKQDPDVKKALDPYILKQVINGCSESAAVACRFEIWQRH